MISFASSIWFWAIAGISIPVFIHLWNIRKGRTLKIGSISLFSESPVSRARSMRLTDLLQLFIRCLLIVMLALFLAKPMLSSKVSQGNTGWVLMEKGRINQSYEQYGKEIDSLLTAGYELHEFAPGFRKMALSDSGSAGDSKFPYWSLLKILEKEIPPNLPVWLYTDKKLVRFEGERPALTISPVWKFVESEGEHRWVENAFETYDDSIIVVEGKSSANQTSFNIRSAGLLDYKDAVDTFSLHVAIYNETGAVDEVYLSGAIEAAKEFTRRKISVEILKDTDKNVDVDWLFWLSTKEIPAQIKAQHIFSYAGTRTLDKAGFFNSNGEEISVYRMYTDSLAVGRPILEKQKNKVVFYSRLDPIWNEWVWSAQFPKFVVDLLCPVIDVKGEDIRGIDPLQAQPVFYTKEVSKTGLIKKDISTWFWFLAFALLVIERVLAYSKQRRALG